MSRGRHRRRRSSLAGATCLALLMGLAACGDSEEPEDTSVDLVIGNSIPLTGDFADLGPGARRAADLAVAQINRAIRESGSDDTVRIVHEDNGTDPVRAIRAARQLVEEDGASCLTGAWASEDTIATAREVTIPEGVLQISPASTSDEVTGLDDDGLVTRTIPPDSLQAETLAEAVADDLGGAEGTTVNLGARDDSYGDSFREAFTGTWEDLGGKIGEEVTYDPEQSSFAAEAEEITSGDPDATVIVDFPETFARVAVALNATGSWDPSTAWGPDGLASAEGATVAGPDAVEGMRGTKPGAPATGVTAVAFERLFGESAETVERPSFEAQTFDAVILCYLAAVAAASVDGDEMAAALIDNTAPAGTEYGWQQLPEAIDALRADEDIDYTGASGPIDLNADGDATAGLYAIYRHRGGKLELIGTVPVPEQD